MLDLPRIPLPLERPSLNIIPKLDLPKVEINLECPNGSDIQEKQAARMIVIRRRKMNRHKLKKLRKRMKFENAKRRQRSELRKEKQFHRNLSREMKRADDFSAEKYVSDKLSKKNELIIPYMWKGRPYPRYIVRQLMGLDPKVNIKPKLKNSN